MVATGLWLFWEVLSDDQYREVLRKLAQGIWITALVAVVAYASACALGLGLALMGLARGVVPRQLARLYVEVMRGVPIIVLLLYVAFVLVPGVVAGWSWGSAWVEGRALAWGGALDLPDLRARDVPLLWRAVIALTLAYSAFLAEVFRAGLLSVEQGQVEAASALGLSGWQRFRLVVFPQAFRTVFPALGNDFVAMVKDSSLVSVLGVTDVTQLGKVTAAGNFRYFETYNVVALIYLTMTIGLSLVLRRVEQRLSQRD